MSDRRDMIVFGDDWGRYPSTIQHMGKVLARDHRLLWVGSLGLRKPDISFYDMQRVWSKGKKIFRAGGSTSFSDPVKVYHPLVIPWHDSGPIRRMNTKMLRDGIRNQLESLGMENPLMLTSSPIVGDLIGTLGETSSHYFCLDDFTLFDRAFSSIRELEHELVERVDSVFSISETLRRTRIPPSGRSYFLPQGVDTNHFIRSSDIPSSVRQLKKPVIGFFGLLSTWVDLTLIRRAAERYPEYSFLVLGKSNVSTAPLEGLSNLHYLGEIPFADLPRVASVFDVGLVPFIINDLTIACNPLKVLEYLSLGLPVVSSRLPEVERLGSFVMTVADGEAFLDAIPQAVGQNTVEGRAGRRAFAEKYGWDEITHGVMDKIAAIEAEKNDMIAQV